MKRKLKCQRAVGNSDGVFTARLGCEFLLKLATFVAGPIVNLSGLQNTDRGFHFVRLEMRPGSKGSRTNGATALQSQLTFNSQGARGAHRGPRTSSVRFERSAISLSTANC